MLVSKAAKRYASALLELAIEREEIKTTLKDVLFIQKTLEDSRDLLLFLKSPIIKPDKKVAALQAIFGDKVSELVGKYISLIAHKNRQNLLDEIMAAFIDKYNEHAGIIRADIFVASALNEQQLDEIKTKLEEVTDKKVNLNTMVQEDLKGGMAIKIADTVIDGTLKHKLQQLEDVFLATAME